MLKTTDFNRARAISLAEWYQPRFRMLTRAVAVLCSLSLLLPALSFAFSADNYLRPLSQGVRLGGPGSEKLAAEYILPEQLGRVVEANFAPGKMTFILIQDLHCHAEIQTNIRTILDRLVARHPDLRLVAVEGGSGIIPTLELAQLPDTAAKRAVAEYFVQQGKLTGADWAALIDRPEIELFGAENQTWYDQSLALIQTFATEENRGLVMEMLDQLDFLQEQQFNPKLLSFERRRKFYQKNDVEQEVYRQDLISEARQHKLQIFPGPLRGRERLVNPDYYAKALQQNYLETELRNRLFLTDVERQLYQYQEFVEIVERLLNVSASREDIQRYGQLAKDVSLSEIMQGLGGNPGGGAQGTAQDIQTLEKALAGAFAFYQLADQRDAALFKNTRQRLIDRRERKAVLITGGYHTQAIMRQARQQGYSYVSLRPAMTRSEAATNYFELLRSPEQPTEFERLLASQPAVPAAMAVRNFLTLQNFRLQFKKAVDFIDGNMVKMRNSEFLQLPGLTLERIRGQLIKMVSEDGSNFMGMLFNRQGIRILAQNDVDDFISRPSVLNSTQMRITALWIVGGSILAVTILPLLGLTTAAYPALGVLGLGLALVGLWWWSGNTSNDLAQRFLTQRNILLGVLAVGAIALPILSLPLLAEVLYAGAVPASGVGAHLAALAASVDQVMSSVPFLAALSPVAQDPARAAVVFQNTSSTISCSMMGVVMGSSKFASLLGKRDVRGEKTTEAQHGRHFTDLRAEETARYLDRKVKKQFGVLIDSDQERPWPGAFEIVSENMVAAWLHLLEANGLRRFSDQVIVDWFTKGEKVPEDKNLTFVQPTPIASEPLFRFPRNRKELASMLFRIVLIDPQFLDEKKQPMHKNIPGRYVEGVLNTLNPARVYEIYKTRLAELLPRAGDNANAFEQILKYSAQKWEGKEAPIDFDTLQQYVSLAFLHEAVHALAMHLPDVIPADLPAEERQALEAISLDRYLEIVNGDQSLQTSVVFTKNLIKALEKVKDEPANKETQDSINILIALEMFCDRFSMYLYENYLKIQIYHEALREEIGYPITVDIMLTLEEARLEGRTEKNRAGQLAKRSEVQGLSSDQLEEMVADLENAETDHVYIDAFQDPKITEKERGFFREFLKLLKHFDNENKIMKFSMDHADTSRFVHATLSGLVQEFAVGVVEFVRENALVYSGPAALAIGIAKQLTAPKEGSTTLDTEMVQVTAEVVEEETPVKEEIALPVINLSAARPTSGVETQVEQVSPFTPAAAGIEEQQAAAAEGPRRKKKLLELFEEEPELPAINLTSSVVQTSAVETADQGREKGRSRTDQNVGLAQDGTGSREVLEPEKKKNLVADTTNEMAVLDQVTARRDTLKQKSGEVTEDMEENVGMGFMTNNTVVTSQPAEFDSQNFAEGLANEALPVAAPLLTGQANLPTETLPFNFETFPEGANPLGQVGTNLMYAQGIPGEGTALGRTGADLGFNPLARGTQPGVQPGVEGVNQTGVLNTGQGRLTLGQAIPGQTEALTTAQGMLLHGQIIPGMDPAGNLVGGTPALWARLPQDMQPSPGTEWTMQPSYDRPGGELNFQAGQVTPGLMPNLDTINALDIPGTVREQILADQRIVFLLGQAAQVLNTLPDGVPMTFGFDSPELKARLDAVLQSMQGTPQGADLAGRVQTELFPTDGRTGARLTPRGWSATNGMVVLTEQMSNVTPLTVVINAEGDAAVGVRVPAIKMDEARKSFAGQAGWAELQATHKELVSQMRNQGELEGYLLISASTVRTIQESQPGLLSNLVTTVIGYQDAQQTGVRLPLQSLQAAAQPAIQQGAQRVVMDFNYHGWQALESAGATDSLGMITFGISDTVISSQAGYDLNSAFLSSLLDADTLESAPLGMAVEQEMLESELGVQGTWFSQWFAELKRRLRLARGEQVAGELSEQTALSQADELLGMDSVTTIISNQNLGAKLQRMRGEEWTEAPSLFASDVYYRFKRGKGLAQAVPNVEAWNPTVEPTAHAQQKGIAKIFSALLLGFAAGALVLDALVQIARTRNRQGKRMPLRLLLQHPNFAKAGQLMVMVVMGRSGAMNQLTPVVRQQLQDLQQVMERDIAIEDLKADEIPQSLKFSMGQFVKFKAFLLNHPIFRLLMRFVNVKNILPLYPELFVLLSESNNMQAVMWYFAPAITLQKSFAQLEGAHPALQASLTRPVEIARQELKDLRAELQQLQSATTTDFTRITQVNQAIKDRRFTLLLQRALDRLGTAHTGQNVRRVVRTLTRELGRRDIAEYEAYQEGILKIMTLIEPFQQTPVQIRQDSGRVLQTSLPASLYETVLRDNLIFFLDAYDTEGKPLAPVKRKILRTGAAA